MSSPSPEAPLVPSAYRPLPEGPSPRWRRSAEGLRWMRLAMYASLTSHLVATVARLVGVLGWPPTPGAAGLTTTYVLGAFDLLTNLAVGVGLWRFGGLPPSTNATRPARQSLTFLAAATALSLLGNWAFALLIPRVVTRGYMLMAGFSLLEQVVLIALHGAYLGLLVRALGAALRSLGEARPTWAPQAVAAYVGWKVVSIPLQTVVMIFARSAPSLVWMLALAADAAIIVALASIMRRTEVTLARQESPESALR